MLFSKDYELIPVQKYGSRRIVTEFTKINCKREGLDTKKDLGNMKHRLQSTGTRAADQSTRVYTEENVTHCEWTDRPTKPGRPETKTSFNTPDIHRETSLTQSSIVQSFTAILVQSVFRLPTRLLLLIVFFTFFTFICHKVM